MVGGVFLVLVVFCVIQYICGYGVPVDPSQINKTTSTTRTSKIIPEAITDYVTSLLSDINARVEELELSREKNVKQMAIMQNEIEEIKSENINLKENMNIINDFLRRKGFNINDILSRKLQKSSHSDAVHIHLNESLHSNPHDNTNGHSLPKRITNERVRRGRTFQRLPSTRADSFGDNVAFHAIMDRDLVNPGRGYEIVFGRVLTNTGGSFSSTTGTFTCGTPGTYVFFWTVTISSDHWTDIHLVRNGQVLAVIVAGNAYHYGSYTGAAIIHLDVGDEVFVKVDFHQENTTIYSTASMFSGFKLF
ncbi:complement C1q subcomponent subunit B-like [Mizuhopecten yessoensis]|uniref:Complement C1q-like protein 4 n=1 Tax=Mizuhopecten yessoensis TaxID=6573 RepID=A0A210QUH9_MIZYE|nr:complement C1q subcomponent subunit B-like [Mizuhopecten yessoensis]OWF52394.1 Complement C1q-like protein 4 [Mizuhopecten yessoensis]